jgi:EAL domain-containing protein (putative c-di-GMP-specific phosphodiesterase class I)/CheY-like chemotaxis protein
VHRVLCVDDEPLILDVVKTMLTRAGFEVTCFNSGREALLALGTSVFDVAVVDYDMPAPNGLELLNRIREFSPTCIRILASGKLDMSIIIDAVNRGEITRVVPKPFRQSHLIDEIRGAIEARSHLLAKLAPAPIQDAGATQDTMDSDLNRTTFRLALQPIVTPQTRDVFAYECLLRPQGGAFNGPEALLIAAERLGRIQDVADAVWRQVAELCERMPQNVQLFVNVHPLELCNVERLERRIEPLTRVSERLIIEVTERCDVLGVDSWNDGIRALVESGFKLAVDDLGSGYSSLIVLATLRPQYLKADKSIVRNLDSDDRKRQLISLLAAFAAGTGASLIAEGVETEAEAAALEKIGVHLQQGYFFGRPDLTIPDRW